MSKCGFNKIALQFCRNRTSAWLFSYKFAAYFQNTFSQEHIWTAASVPISPYMYLQQKNTSSKVLMNTNRSTLA